MWSETPHCLGLWLLLHAFPDLPKLLTSPAVVAGDTCMRKCVCTCSCKKCNKVTTGAPSAHDSNEYGQWCVYTTHVRPKSYSLKRTTTPLGNDVWSASSSHPVTSGSHLARGGVLFTSLPLRISRLLILVEFLKSFFPVCLQVHILCGIALMKESMLLASIYCLSWWHINASVLSVWGAWPVELRWTC